MSSLFDEVIRKQPRKTRYNPRPVVPPTQWVKPTFPDLSRASYLMVDVETSDPGLEDYGPGWGRGDGHIVGIAIGADDDYRAYYPMRHTEEGHDNFEPHHVLAYASEQLGRRYQPKINHNIFYDLGWLAEEGVEVIGDLICTQSAETLIGFDQSGHSLEKLGLKYTGGGKTSHELLLWLHQYYGTGPADANALKKQRGNIHRTPPRLCAQYGEGDVDLPYWVWGAQEPQLQELGMMNLFQMEMHLLRVLLKTRMHGVTVDPKAAEAARDALQKRMDEIHVELKHITGTELNWQSGSQVAKYLISRGIRVPYTAKGAPSVTEEFLDELDIPEAPLIAEWRMNRKFKTTFIESYILDSNVKGKVYGSFNPLRAITGRMSSDSPNLQNLPSRNELAKAVRSIFIPDTGHEFWCKKDYASVEYRVFAHFAEGEGSNQLRQQYRDDPNTDYHNYTMNMVHQLTGQMLARKHIKNVNFSILYGAQVKKLARILGMDIAAATALLNSYHEGLPYVRETMSATSSSIHRIGHSRTICGRRVYFDLWEPRERELGTWNPALPYEEALNAYGAQIKRAATYKGLNYKIQGSAADLMKAGLVLCDQAGIFDVLGPPRLIVHDEVDYSVPEWNETVREALIEGKRIMENAIPFAVPIRMDAEWGPNWSELYDLDLAA